MHFGGTPTFFTSQLEEVKMQLKLFFRTLVLMLKFHVKLIQDTLQKNMECIKSLGGCNRLSFGVQDLDETVQRQFRIQPFELTQNVTK